MTDPAPETQPTQSASRTPRPRRRKPSKYPVVAGSLATFMALFGFMAYQLRTGHDPALSRQALAASAPPTKRVVLRRIEDRIIVTRVIPPSDDGEGGAVQLAVPAQASAPATQSAPVIVRSSPAPAPAPAPLVTSASGAVR
jgi:hypothetical protein